MRGGRATRTTVATLLALAGLAAPHPAAAAPTTHPGTEPLRIVVERLDPKAPRPGTVLTLGGWVENMGSDDLTGVRVRLRAAARALVSRSELAVLARERGPVGARVPAAEADPVATLGRGRRAAWRLAVPTDRLGFGGFGVHALQLEVRARSAGGSAHPVARLTTFLPWAPSTSRVAPTRLVWLWPVAATPVQSLRGTFLDDDLAAAVAPGGRLHRLVGAGGRPNTPASPVPVTWVIDPALLRAAVDMADGYPVASRGQPEHPGRGAAAARDWLVDLRRAIREPPPTARGSTVLPLPYADPDIVALDRIGLNGDLGYQTRTGGQLVAHALGDPPPNLLDGVAWPPDGLVTAGALETLVGAGTRSLVLADTALPPARPPSYTPDAGAAVDTIAGTLPVALTDTTLTATLGAARTPEDARLVEQRFLAETALITAELPRRSRTIVVAPPRQWNPPAALARNLLADTARLPWLAPARLSDVLRTGTGDTPLARRGPRYPDAATDAELDTAHLAGVASLARDVRLVRSILVGDRGLGTDLVFARWRTESAAWRTDPGTGGRLLRAVRAAVDDAHARVGIASAGLFTLTSRTGRVPLTVSNGLDENVRVQIALRARNAAALATPPPTIVTIAGGQKPTIPLSVTARVNGIIPVTAQLLTPDGRPLSSVVTLRVRSTAYCDVGLAVTLGALAVLLLAVTVRFARRALRATARHRGGRPPA